MSAERVLYSIQQTYILTHVLTPEREIVTCNQRIDIPTIEPLTEIKAVVYQEQPGTVVPCIELAGAFLSEFDLTFETNEGVTVLPERIVMGMREPLKNPYTHARYVLALPRGATGVKSCKLIQKATGKEVQHNFTFGIMPPPYNYDNALFGYLSYGVDKNSEDISDLAKKVNVLKISTQPLELSSIELPKGAGKQTINIGNVTPFYETNFDYSSSPETTIHKPKITLRGGDGLDYVYTLSLNRTLTVVSIDLLTGMITAYDEDTGEILKQFKLGSPYNGFTKLSFENFDDIDTDVLFVKMKLVMVKYD